MTLSELEKTITQLPPDDLSKFRTWFLDFDAQRWDQIIEADTVNGRLDKIGGESDS